MRAQVTDEMGTPLEGFGFEDCQPVLRRRYRLDSALEGWQENGRPERSLPAPGDRNSPAPACTAIRGDYVKAMPRDIARHREYGDVPEPGIGW